MLLIGFILGLLAVAGPLSFLNDLGAPVAATFVSMGRDSIMWLVDRFGLDPASTVVVVAAATLSVAMPGVIASLIVLIGRAGQNVAKLGAVACVAVAGVVVWTQRDLLSVVTAILLLLFALTLALALSTLISLTSGALAALIVGAQVRLVYLNDDPSISAAHETLVAAFPAIDPTLLTYLLVALAVVPLASIAWSLLK